MTTNDQMRALCEAATEHSPFQKTVLQIESIIGEFGDNPPSCLAIICEYLGLTMHEQQKMFYNQRKVVLVSGTDGIYDGVHIANTSVPFHTLCYFGGDVDATVAVSDNNHKITCKECFQLWERSRFFGLDNFSDKLVEEYRKSTP